MEMLNMPQWFRETGPKVLKACSFLQTALPFIMWSEDSVLLEICCFASKIYKQKKKIQSKNKLSPSIQWIFWKWITVRQRKMNFVYIQSAFLSAKINGWFSFKVKISNPSRWSYVGLPQKSLSSACIYSLNNRLK